jgi:DNA-binding LacI/PurR family transcriptional regulator
VSIKDVALQAGVSMSTVSRVFNLTNSCLSLILGKSHALLSTETRNQLCGRR